MYDYQFSDTALTSWVLLRQTWTGMYRAAQVKFAKLGLTPEQMDVLWICRDYPTPPLTTTELSRLLFRKPHTTTELLKRMEREGLVRIVPKRKGRPFTEIKLTAKGKKAVVPGIEIVKALVTSIMSCLSPEEHEQLQKLLRALQQNVGEELRLEVSPPPYYPRQPIPIDW